MEVVVAVEMADSHALSAQALQREAQEDREAAAEREREKLQERP
jgi:hypothetical protein